MIGLEYVCKVRCIQYKDLAVQLNLSPKTINDWVMERKSIPEARLNSLSRLFELDKELLQQDINKDGKIIVLNKEIERIER